MASETEPDLDSHVPVVGIGASAGGLAAFEAFFSGMPAGGSPGMALVLIQHLAPDHESHLVELVRRQTDLEVFEVTDGMKVERNAVYVIPPAKAMVLRDGHMRLLEPTEPRGHRLPIDFFFQSLAEEQGERAVCVVLSGTGSDGTRGVRAVYEGGGLVVAQDPALTEYAGMPRSAIATGMVNHVLPANRIFGFLIDRAAHGSEESEPRSSEASDPAGGASPSAGASASTTSTPTSASESDGAASDADEEEVLGEIFSLLRGRSGHDFTNYKRNSIRRRIHRRMAVQQVERMEEYVQYLARVPEEIDALFQDLLIGVTRFFRDSEAFLALEEKGIPELLADRSARSTLRVWVPGCSTGEEAYSIAILLREQMQAAGVRSKLQVFATDIDARAIEVARAGRYPASIRDDVSAERLERCFTPENGGEAYRIRKSIRDLLVFSEQDLVTDPPFSRLDLISCRNVLIYMGPELQKRLIPIFHYALNPGGILFLGTSESVGDFEGLFDPLDRSGKLFQRTDDVSARTRRTLGPFAPGPPRLHRKAVHGKPSAGTSSEDRWSPGELMKRELLKHHAPAAALVSADGEILYLHGRTGRFLEPAPGEGRLNIQEMAREGLRRELAVSLHRAVTRKEPEHRSGLRVQTDGVPVTVDLTIRSVSAGSEDSSAPTLYLVVLDDRGTRAPREADPAPDADAVESEEASPRSTDSRVARLEEELRAKEEYLEAVLEEMQTSNEELRSSNEELQSTNEELQSTNEEMETSKEELQSVNEELATINAELEAKVTDLSRAENDMKNLLAGTGIGTVFVDHELRIQRFTPSATEILNLIQSDVGRPVGDLTSRLPNYARLKGDIEHVLETLVPSEAEVQTQAGAWYLLRIRPYRTLENVIEGAVITFTDITEVKEARASLREAEALRRLSVVVEDANDAVTMQDLEGQILAWNPAATRTYGWTQTEALTMNYLDLAPDDRKDETRALLDRLRRGDAPAPFMTLRRTRDDRILTAWITATALVDEAGSTYALATTERIIEPDAPSSEGGGAA